MDDSFYSEETTWLEMTDIVEIRKPTVKNPKRRLMLVEFELKGDSEFGEAFTWAPRWKDVVDILIRALVVEHQNTPRRVDELVAALKNVGALKGYLIRS